MIDRPFIPRMITINRGSWMAQLSLLKYLQAAEEPIQSANRLLYRSYTATVSVVVVGGN